ncbi:hypothetical protein ACFQHO_41840 [Actinomadura yumaensis]|uniref:hypothetical protein n=1 Tax=Actinomadura yumaensis TaxID=111807 RepID=UPI0036229B4C
MSVLDHDVRPGSFWARLAVTERQALRAMGRRTVVPPGGMLCHQGVTAPGVHVLFGSGARTVTNVVAKEFVDSSEGDESIIELYGAGDLIGGSPRGGTRSGGRSRRSATSRRCASTAASSAACWTPTRR